MGNELKRFGAVIRCWTPDMTNYPLSFWAILRETMFITILILNDHAVEKV